ncbi:HU family DNA-binding protein [Fusobacterium ulcerans]|uniref:HU family DNA-binding protein n=1 Tax=Fusobacterium ulcerans TaxID=861 RepID=UPI001D0B72AE|nr:HU family DNA-binding protein [Fusobacterium ulcerans]MCB8566563.1 HU family DNA-binding protein [Fusobacterium ulcerans]MCB8650209.1 HU family DNA-binding protein [Fusobacterium ulcerans]
MNKREFAKVYKKISPYDVTIETVLTDVDIFLETLREALQIEGEVKFIRRGTFEVISRQPRVISNPATRERMTVYPKKIVRFRASKKIK